MAHLKTPISGDLWLENRQRAIALFRSKRTFLFSAYPDADALGTMLALALYLKQLGKTASLFFPSPVKQNLQFMKDIIEFNDIPIIKDEKELKALQNEVDTVVFCDTANAGLVPFATTFQQCYLDRGIAVVEIDHHFGTDSAAIAEEGIHLFRTANASTEIAAELLQDLHRHYPSLPAPFSQRNIVISLLMGLLTDTFGGRAVPLRQDYDYWHQLLGEHLKVETQSDSGDFRRNDGMIQFVRPQEILAHLNRLSPELERNVEMLKKKIIRHEDVGELDLLDSSLKQLSRDPVEKGNGDFFQLWNAMANVVPQTGGKVGLFYFNGKNAEGKDCLFLKIRRAFDFNRFDLRESETALKKTFGQQYLGGGGHAGAVSFRIQPMGEPEFHLKVSGIVDFLQNQVR